VVLYQLSYTPSKGMTTLSGGQARHLRTLGEQ